MAGDAAGVCDEVDVGALQVRNGVLDGALNGVVAPDIERNRREMAGFRTGFQEQLDDGSVSVVPGDIERRQAFIAGLYMLVDGVYVGAAIDEELHSLDGEHI